MLPHLKMLFFCQLQELQLHHGITFVHPFLLYVGYDCGTVVTASVQDLSICDCINCRHMMCQIVCTNFASFWIYIIVHVCAVNHATLVIAL